MNFLAHLHLSESNEDIMIGNFIADFVKGKNYEHYPEGIKQGIIIHRHIDYFTDTHPTVTKSKQKLYSKYHKYSGVIVDVFYDHFLAIKWEDYSEISLTDFAGNFYYLVNNYIAYLPEKVNEFLPDMIKNDWLVNYRNLDGIDRALNGMARRTTFDSGMETALVALRQNYGEFKEDFQSYYPELIEYVQKLINDFQDGKADI